VAHGATSRMRPREDRRDVLNTESSRTRGLKPRG